LAVAFQELNRTPVQQCQKLEVKQTVYRFYCWSWEIRKRRFGSGGFLSYASVLYVTAARMTELPTVSNYSAMLRCLKFIEFEILLPIELKINRKFVVTRIFENIYRLV
jgi:hypothetical protein